MSAVLSAPQPAGSQEAALLDIPRSSSCGEHVVLAPWQHLEAIAACLGLNSVPHPPKFMSPQTLRMDPI